MQRQTLLRLSSGIFLALIACFMVLLYNQPGVSASSLDRGDGPATVGASLGQAAKVGTLPVVVDSSQDFDIVKVAEGVYAAITRPAGLPSGNAGFVIGKDGVLVVDTTLAPVTALELIAEIKKITPLPIKYAVNTHYHVDHSGGNQVFAEMKVPIVAQENTRDWVTTRNKKFFPPGDALRKAHDDTAKQLADLGAADAQKRAQLERRLRSIDAELSIKLTAPDVAYKTGSIERDLGSRKVVIATFPGHTGGDSIVYVPDANVVFGGDLDWHKTLPNLVDATVNDWIPTLDTLLGEHPNAAFVPGHGSVGTAAEAREFREYLSDLRETVKKAIADGLTLDQAKTQLKLPEKYKSFAIQAFVQPDIENMYNELKGTKVYN